MQKERQLKDHTDLKIALAILIPSFIVGALIVIGTNTAFAAFNFGTEGDDNIKSGDDNDGNQGNGGNDRIRSGGGDDSNTGDGFRVNDDGGDDRISSGDGDDRNIGDNNIGGGTGGDDKIKSGKGDDVSCGDNGEHTRDPVTDELTTNCGDLGGPGGDDKINSGQGDDELTGNGGADKFNCGNGDDTVLDFNEEEGDKAAGNCENLESDD